MTFRHSLFGQCFLLLIVRYFSITKISKGKLFSKHIFVIHYLQLISCGSTGNGAVTKESIYTTCDFDLEGIESLLQHLPAICIEIYKSRLTYPDLYQTYLDESKAFAKFYTKLDDYELGPQHNQHAELVEYPFDNKLRVEIYRKTNWADCIISANNSASEYLNCVTKKRNELEQLVPSGGST